MIFKNVRSKYLVATIAYSSVGLVSARLQESLGIGWKIHGLNRFLELMTRMVTMRSTSETRNAKVIIFAIDAGHKSIFWKHYRVVSTCGEWGIRRTFNAAVASPGWLGKFLQLLLIHEGTRHVLWSFALGTGTNSLGSTGDDGSFVGKQTSDKPVVLALAMNTSILARNAKVVISIVAYITMVVFTQHVLVAIVAIHRPVICQEVILNRNVLRSRLTSLMVEGSKLWCTAGFRVISWYRLWGKGYRRDIVVRSYAIPLLINGLLGQLGSLTEKSSQIIEFVFLRNFAKGLGRDIDACHWRRKRRRQV
jgi:hypothetical protein